MKKIFGEKGILNGKRVLTATLVIVLLSGITLYSVAAGHTWKSQGNIAAVRSDGTKTVIFDKSDLDYLDGRIDAIEADVSTGKENLANALNPLGTNPSLGTPLSGTSTFNELMEAINHSQAIPDKTIGESVSIATEDYELASKVTGQTINSNTKINAATADNLSLGTSAWVDGSLLIGTGADNKNYYNLGYTNGMAKVDNASIIYTYHSHKGTVQGGGECYTPLYRVHTHSGSCYSTVNSTCTCSAYAGQWINDTIFRCRVCWHAGHGPGGTCGAATTSTVLSCGKAEGTRYQSEGLETYVLSCGKTESTIETATIHFN
jgi:hypothetical protein